MGKRDHTVVDIVHCFVKDMKTEVFCDLERWGCVAYLLEKRRDGVVLGPSRQDLRMTSLLPT